VYVGQPTHEGRLTYLKNKLKPGKMETDKEIERLANETDGFSFGDLLELVTAVYALKENVDDVIIRLKGGISIGEVPLDATSASRFYAVPNSVLASSSSVKSESSLGSHLDMFELKKALSRSLSK